MVWQSHLSEGSVGVLHPQPKLCLLASRVLGLSFVVFGSSCTASWVRPSLFVLVRAQRIWTVRYSTRGLAPQAETCFAPTMLFSCTSETGHRAFELSLRLQTGPLCVGPVLKRTLLEPTPPARFGAPLATSASESGLPGLTTPGTFRPWAFSSLRRFPPPDALPVVFHTGATYGVQRTETYRAQSPCRGWCIQRKYHPGLKVRTHKRPRSFAWVNRFGLQLRAAPRPILCSSTQRQCVTHRASRKRKAREAGTPTCQLAPDRPCEEPFVAATVCDLPVVRRTLTTIGEPTVSRFCHYPCLVLVCGKKTIRLRKPAVPAFCQEFGASTPHLQQICQDQPLFVPSNANRIGPLFDFTS